MKDIHEVMRQKELAVARLKKEIEALRIVVPMLQDKETTPAKTPSATQNSESQSTPPNTQRLLAKNRLRTNYKLRSAA